MPRDNAFLLVSFGGPEGPDDVMPFLRNVTAGRGVPDERLAKVAEHYYQFGGVSPINAQMPRADRRNREGLRHRRHRAAGLLGQPELAALPHRHDGRHGERRNQARDRAGDLRLQFVLQLPAVPGRHRPGQGRGRAGGAGSHQDPALLPPSRLHRLVHRRDPGRPRLTAARGHARGRADLHRAQHPDVHGGRQRPDGRRVPRLSSRWSQSWSRPASAGRAGGCPTRVAAARHRCPGSSPISTTPSKRSPRPGRPQPWSCRSGSSAITWRSSST